MSDRAWFEEAFDAPYLEVYAHRDSREAEAATRALLAPLDLRGRRVLDLACGGGRYLEALHKHQVRAVGFDLSLPLLQAAHERTRLQPQVLGLVRGNMLHLPFAASSFDLVLSMFTSFGYFANPQEDLHVLAEIHRVLETDGDLFLDLFNAVRVRRELAPHSRRRAGRFEVRERRHLDAGRNTVVKEIELRDGASVRRYREEVRLWEAGPLEAALEHCGFSLEARWGSYTGSSYAPDRSERLIVRARRRRHA